MNEQTNINNFQISLGSILLIILMIAVGTALGIWVANRVV